MLRIAEKSSLILDNLPSPYYARKGCINSEDYKTFIRTLQKDYKTFITLIRIILHHYIILFHNTFPQVINTLSTDYTPFFNNYVENYRKQMYIYKGI